MRFNSETLKLLGVINGNIIRRFDEGLFRSAEFELSDGNYKVYSDYSIERTDKYGVVTELPVHYCKGGVYPEVRVCGMPIKMYVLVMICVDESAYDKYASGLDINHTVITEITPKQLSIGYYADGSVLKTVRTAPLRDVSFDPSYLEFCSASDNTKHGNFVNSFRLYNVYVSANDVDELRGMLVEYNEEFAGHLEDWVNMNKDIVVNYYRKKGEKKRLVFEAA